MLQSACLSMLVIFLLTMVGGVSSCVMNAVSPVIMRNTSMSYQSKIDLFYANTAALSAWAINVSVLTSSNTSFVPVPPLPSLCPQLITAPTFTPNSLFAFQFAFSRVRNIVNLTAAGTRCGLDCSGALGGSVGNVIGVPVADRDVVGTENVSYTTRLKNGTNITTTMVAAVLSNTSADIRCTIDNVTNAVPWDAVCTAYILYNSIYWENSSAFVMPPQTEPAS
ncbi:membrane-associated protein, putative [Bodo saltans]|uniref:Membrane-associated protein, putative n=1 Tax=Bodo saltans TaxID=75058 RepID=A0A0S4J4H3_BODSA|nr:membrane-associated protein, putative [Bodo saltans]|eukprot:CUG86369.1 membrane-associated protein, putative [Bodo saltans]